MAGNLGKSDKKRPVLKSDYEKDKVYVYQFGRAGCVPSASPFCLKIETWIRMAGIKYENVITDISRNSSHQGKLPFVEINGEEIADSHFIILQLMDQFGANLEANLTEKDKAIGRSVEAMADDVMFWCMIYFRHKNLDLFMSEKVMGPALVGFMSYMKPLAKIVFGRRLSTKLYGHGMGSHTPEEVNHIGKEILDSLNVILGENQYILGDTPTRFDATIFGQLVQIAYVPPETELQKHLKENTPKLMEYLENIKTKFWPDWEECTKELKMNTSYNLPAAEATEAEEAKD